MYLIDYNFVINEPSCVCSGRTFSNTRKSVLNCKKIKALILNYIHLLFANHCKYKDFYAAYY